MENGPDNQKTKDEERRISDQCAYESWLQDKHPCEDGVRSLPDHIEECAKTAIQPSDPSLPAEEIETLEFCISELRPYFDDLTKWLIDPLEKSRPYQREVAFEKLWGLTGSTLRIGVHATLTKGVENYFRPLIKREAVIAQAELAAREKKKKVTRRGCFG